MTKHGNCYTCIPCTSEVNLFYVFKIALAMTLRIPFISILCGTFDFIHLTIFDNRVILPYIHRDEYLTQKFCLQISGLFEMDFSIRSTVPYSIRGVPESEKGAA